MTEAAKNSIRRPPLSHSTCASSGETALDPVDVRPMAPRTRLVLRIDPALLPASEVAGFPLDMPINRHRACARGRALRLGPDEWLLWAPPADARGVAADVRAALAGRHLSLVDISHGGAAFTVSGPAAASVLNSGCPLDLSPAAFPIGTATRTLIGKCEVVLARVDVHPTFEVECGRSFAHYLRDFLAAAVRGMDGPGAA